jgi:CPA1 family monovalent cation:H+ antiporter
MNAFDIAAVLITVAAVSGYLNHRVLNLPPTSGTLLVALASSLLVLAVDTSSPQLGLRAMVSAFLSKIDFNETLMHGMLAFLLFAGALQVDFRALFEHKWTIGALATVGVLLSTVIIGALTWWGFALVGVGAPALACVAFGALISPTDPIAVMGLLKDLRAPRSLATQIAGESLFNDGIGVVVFLAALSLVPVAPDAGAAANGLNAARLATFFLREVIGGVALGLALGYLGYRMLKSINDHPLELLITLALAMFIYAASFWIHVSGPIAVVVAGLLIGNHGRRFAMSQRTRDHVDAFWNMIDELLNALLFLLLGLQVFLVQAGPKAIVAGVLSIPIVLLARVVSVGLPVMAMSVRGRFPRGFVPVLTWSGLRGGISVAMALSLPPFPARDTLLACTYAVVVFSILVQGLTMRRVLVHYGVAEER